MPIEVADIGEVVPENAQIVQDNEQIAQDNEQIAQDVPGNVASEAVPKKRGRPPGSKNKAKVEAPPPAQAKKRSRVVVVQESESESEEELPPPLSPAAQRRSQWAAYRQKQMDAHQARQDHYTRALEKMLGF